MTHTIIVHELKSAFTMFRILIDNNYSCHMRTSQKYHSGKSGAFYTIFIIEYTDDDDPN